MFRFSATQWIYGNEEIEISLKRLKRFGYDGVELAGEPSSLNVEEVNRLLREYGLNCSSICGIYTKERDLSSQNQDIRRNAVRYVKDCIDLAVSVGAPLVIVVPSPVGKNSPDSTYEEEWKHSVVSIREAGEYAKVKGITLAIEALNRFETYLINRLSDAMKLVEHTNLENVRLMADLFHMNIEERDISASIRTIAPLLAHVHIADNTREAAGLGSTDFKQVMRTLIEVGYQGYITMEFLPAISNPYLASKRVANEANSIFDRYTQQSIDHIKHIVASLT